MDPRPVYQAPLCHHIKAFSSAFGFTHLDVVLRFVFGSDRNAKIRAPRCSSCKLTCNRLHACLECVFVGCWERSHIQDHARFHQHSLALELRRFHVFCFVCSDYVYDRAIGVAFQQHMRTASISHREQESYNLIVAPDALTPRLEAQRKTGFWHFSLKHDRHPFSGLRGMLNLGNTCFMNVVLQTLVHNPLIRDFFLKDGHNRNLCSLHGDALCLGCDMDLIFEKAFHGETEPYAPHQFLCAMWSHASHLAGYEQQDAHEFLISLLDALHSRCGGTTSADCDCVVHRTFGGKFRSVVTCLNCFSTYTAYDPLLEVAVDLTAMHHPNSLLPQTLVDCFDRFTQPERLSDKFLCRNCQAHHFSTKQLSIHTLPAVLTVHLKRFKHLGLSASQTAKLDAYISFPINDLDLSCYVSDPAVAKSEIQLGTFVYSLFAVVEHKGSSESGHYIAYIRRQQQWYKCDDAKISQKSEREVLSSQAYMLFYLKTSN